MAVVALALGLGLGACSQSNTPDTYGTLTQQNFLEVCTNFYFDNTDDDLTITDNTVTDDAVNPPDQATCQCMYELFSGPVADGDGTEGGMPINASVAKAAGWTGPNFTDLNAELKNDPQQAWDSLPEDPFKNGITACQESGGRSGDSSTTSSTTSTTVATDESTTTTGA